MSKNVEPVCAVLLCLAFVAAPAQGQDAASRPAAPAGGKLSRVAVLGEAAFRHGGTISHVVALPDGRRVLTTGADGSARLWELATGKELRRFCQPRGERVWGAALVPGGGGFCTAGAEGCVIRWRFGDATPVKEYKQEGDVFRLAVDAGGTQIATADSKKRSVLLDLKSGREVRRFTGHKERVYTVLFAAGGKKLITAGSDETIRYWDLATGKELNQIKNATGDVYTLVGGPKHKRILVCCAKKSVWVMDAESGKEVWQAKLPKGVHCGAWSGDGKLVAASCQDDNLYVLDAATGLKKWTAKLPGGTNYGVAFSTDGSEVLCGSGHLLCRFDAKTGKRLYPRPDAPAQNSPVSAVGAMPKSRAVLHADSGLGLRVLDRDTGAVRHVWLATEDVDVAAVSADGGTILAAGSGAVAWLLDGRNGKVLHRLTHGESVSGVAFTPDGKLAVTVRGGGNTSANAVIWRVRDGKAVHRLTGHRFMNDVSIGPRGRRMIALCKEELLRVWSLQSGRLLGEISLKGKGPKCCALSPVDAHSILVREKTGLALWASPRVKAAALTAARIRELVVQLGSAKYQVRASATRQLIQGGQGVAEALDNVKSDDPEVQMRIAHIQEAALKAGQAYKQKASIALKESPSSSIALHPDGRHWAALEGGLASTRIVLGRMGEGKLTVVGRIEDLNMPAVLRFGPDGRLYVGNRNGTITVYAPAAAPE